MGQGYIQLNILNMGAKAVTTFTVHLLEKVWLNEKASEIWFWSHFRSQVYNIRNEAQQQDVYRRVSILPTILL